MKRLLLIIAGMSAATLMSAQIPPETDWADFGRYSEANRTVTERPKAILMGDSITDLWDDKDPSFFTENNILCRGISGQTTSQMLVRFRKDVIQHCPEYVIIMAGTNDIARNTGYIALDDIVGNIISMCELAKQNDIKPVIVSIPPCKLYLWRPDVEDPAGKIIEVNNMLREYASKNHIRYADVHSIMKDGQGGLPEIYSKDEVHPTLEGYAVMRPVILGTIE